MNISRRTLLSVGPLLVTVAATRLRAESGPTIHVVKDPGCPCCNAWIGHLRDSGFSVTFEERSVEELATFKRERGIPAELASCHTAVIGVYTIEGHVPSIDIQRLLSQAPEAVGLTVPGMPYGSPGMGPETEREAYEVILIGFDGTSSTFSAYPAG